VGHIYNPNTRETEERGSVRRRRSVWAAQCVQGHSGLDRETPSQKKTKNLKTTKTRRQDIGFLNWWDMWKCRRHVK
jgi:hypothetical protein